MKKFGTKKDEIVCGRIAMTYLGFDVKRRER